MVTSISTRRLPRLSELERKFEHLHSIFQRARKDPHSGIEANERIELWKWATYRCRNTFVVELNSAASELHGKVTFQTAESNLDEWKTLCHLHFDATGIVVTTSTIIDKVIGFHYLSDNNCITSIIKGIALMPEPLRHCRWTGDDVIARERDYQTLSVVFDSFSKSFERRSEFAARTTVIGRLFTFRFRVELDVHESLVGVVQAHYTDMSLDRPRLVGEFRFGLDGLTSIPEEGGQAIDLTKVEDQKRLKEFIVGYSFVHPSVSEAFGLATCSR
jgi:hypothetical protein